MTKMVQLSDEAYRRLKAQKGKGESFSDVVLRLTPQSSLLDLARDRRTDAEIQAHLAFLAEMRTRDMPDYDRIRRTPA
jgi:predicted CopG family antitoxin